MTRLKVLLGVAVSAALLAYLLRSVDLHELGVQLGKTRWEWVALGIVLGLLTLYTRAIRWWYLFPPRSNPQGLVPAMWIGYMMNNILPLRAGEVVRVWVVARRQGHGFWTTAVTLVVERVLDSLVVVLLLAVLVLMIPVPPAFAWAAVVLLVIDAVAVAVLVGLVVAPERCQLWLHRIVSRIPRLAPRAERVLAAFLRGLDGVRSRSHLVPLLFWTTVSWVLPAAANWATLRAMHLDLPWLAGWVVLAFVGLGVSIPSAPGYLGVYHVAAAKAVAIFGAPPSAVVGFALILHASQTVPITVIGWIYLIRERLSLADLRRARPAPAAEG